MKILVTLLVLALVQATLSARKRREADDEMTKYGADALATLCVLNCLDQHQRKGVEGPVKKPIPLESGCDNLDMRELVDMCKAFNQAGSCLNSCPTSESRTAILDGLKHICVTKFADFQKFTPCFNQQCPAVEEKCAEPCGGLDDFQNELIAQITDNETETGLRPGLAISVLGRRKRESVLTSTSPAPSGEKTTPDPPDYTDPPVLEGVDEESARSGFLGVCKYLGCYVNCSRPILVKECGEEAHELLEYTAQMLVSIVMTPFKILNSNASQMMFDGCSDTRFVPTAHKLTSGASPSTFGYLTVVTLIAAVFAGLMK